MKKLLKHPAIRGLIIALIAFLVYIFWPINRDVEPSSNAVFYRGAP